MTGPTPDTSVSVAPGAFHRGGQLLLRLAQLGVNAAQVLQEVAGQLPAGQHDRARRDGLLQQACRAGCGDFLPHAAGDQLAQHRVQPAGNLVTGPGQVPVPPGPHLQHGRVIAGPDLAAASRAQRGDRD
jgi:hypothetical protein